MAGNFLHYSSASEDNKKLILFDGRISHKSLAVLEYTKENGIVLFCFPAHSMHRVQPIEVGFFGPLQIYYDQGFRRG